MQEIPTKTLPVAELGTERLQLSDLSPDIDQIINGDCLVIMQNMADESIDCIVTDPPYGISFMGKNWDKALPSVEIWKECLRVLKPGAFAFVMCIPRQDCLSRMIINLEDAGFMVNFSPLYHTFACLSDDTEVLTKYGWERLRMSKTPLTNGSVSDIIIGVDKAFAEKEILTYDTETERYGWEVPERWSAYRIKDTCYRIESDSTDQLVTTGHRCYVEREGRLLWNYAERLSSLEEFPVLGDLYSLREDNFSTGEEYRKVARVLAGMPNKQPQKEEGQTIRRSSSESRIDLPNMRQGVLSQREGTATSRWEILLSQLQGKSNHSQSVSDRQTYPSHERRTEAKATGSHDGRQKPCVEGRGNLFQNTWQLLWRQIHSLSERLSGYGAEGWLCHGAQAISGAAVGASVAQIGSGASYRSQSRQQPERQSNPFRIKQGPQATRTRTSYQTTLATVRKEHYNGIVFCPTVSTGCFVARRNGKIFLTGNSGFPKASNVAKNIDKRLGMEREVVGVSEYYSAGRTHDNMSAGGEGGTGQRNRSITTPATPEAKALDGSYAGFQPKPAVEVVLVVMKPLSEKTYLDQALANGKGISWLEDGRIPYEANVYPLNWKKDRERIDDSGWMFRGGKPTEMSPQGRFAPNLLVSDDVLNDGRIIKSSYVTGRGQLTYFGGKESGNIPKTPMFDSGSYSRYFSLDAWSDKYLPDSVKKVFPFLIVPKASKSEKNAGLDELEEKIVECLQGNKDGSINKRTNGKPSKAKNHHATVKPIKLMSYLIMIGSRPDDIILDPFCGSGTTCIAAAILDRRYIGIELDDEMCDISDRRIAWHVEQASEEAGQQPDLFAEAAGD